MKTTDSSDVIHGDEQCRDGHYRAKQDLRTKTVTSTGGEPAAELNPNNSTLTASSPAIGPSKARGLRRQDALSGLHEGDVMPTLTVTIPSSLETVLKDAVVGRGSSRVATAVT